MSYINIYKLASELLRVAQTPAPTATSTKSNDGVETSTVSDSFQDVIEVIKGQLNANIGELLNNPKYSELFPAGEFSVSVVVTGTTPSFKLTPSAPAAEKVLNSAPTVGGLVSKSFASKGLKTTSPVPFNNIVSF